MSAAPSTLPAPPSMRALRQGVGWHVGEYLCTAGPDDPVFEERHEGFSVAVVIEGSFRYRSPAGTALLYPGALLLGNHGACYECGHDHGRGDRCVGFHVAPEVFQEVAASRAGSGRFAFPVGALPALPRLGPRLARARAALASPVALAAEEAVLGLVEAVIDTCAEAARSARPVSAGPRWSAADARRIGEVAEYVTAHAELDLDLALLAARAAMSKYHFLRVFRRVLGMTPHQFLLETRMRQAATRLLQDPAPIATVAFDAGFNDLSTFNARFRRQFGCSPGDWRAQAPRRFAPTFHPSRP